MSVENCSLAIVGAGVSGCALAARLRVLGWRGAITLLEAGQGAGGRAASRRSRSHPGWRLDHGAPFFTLPAADPPELLAPLLAAGRLRSWPSPGAVDAPAPLRRLEQDGSLVDEAGGFAASGRLYRGWPAMADLAEGLLELAQAAQAPGGRAEGAPPLQRRHGCRVEALDHRDGLWQLRDGAGDLQVQADWLVLSATLLAHPRCLPLLGLADIPLRVAQRHLADPGVERALQAIARRGS
jgi:predicted NAD/FAD-dependent oxidoreductase